MNKALLDSDIFSEILKGRNLAVVARAAAYRTVFPFFTISTVTVMEIVKGLHKMRRETRIQHVLNVVAASELLTLDVHSAEQAGRIDGDLERIGQSIGVADPLIAAIALQYNLTLVTGNTAHYQRIQALGYPLQLDNWR